MLSCDLSVLIHINPNIGTSDPDVLCRTKSCASWLSLPRASYGLVIIIACSITSPSLSQCHLSIYNVILHSSRYLENFVVVLCVILLLSCLLAFRSSYSNRRITSFAALNHSYVQLPNSEVMPSTNIKERLSCTLFRPSNTVQKASELFLLYSEAAVSRTKQP